MEVKCPYTHHFTGAAPDYLIKNNEEYELSKKHNYYYQVQGQLYVCQKNMCYFVVYTFPKLNIVSV